VVFLEAWRKRHRVELDRESALPWLLGVATNVVLNHRRSLRRYRAALSRVPLPEVGAAASSGVDDFSDDVTRRIAAESEMQLILDLVQHLPERERQVLELCAWDGLSYADVAAVVGVPVGTVRSRLSRARTRLRELECRSGHERGVYRSVQIVPEAE
jgi:RNA polymerase sigma-70 factor (ECF subfamily)